MQNLSCELKSHKDKTYIQYTYHANNPIVVTSADYSQFNVTSEAFKQATKNIGGFFANMTSRTIQTLQADITTLMLVCIPTKYIEPKFYFVYLDKDDNIIEKITNDNLLDYNYFRNKLSKSMIQEGLIYELTDNDKFKSITDEIAPNATLTVNLCIDKRYATLNDTLICHSFNIFEEKFIQKLNQINAKGVELQFKSNILNMLYLEGKIFDKNNEFLKEFQVESGINDFDMYTKTMRENNTGYSEDFVTADKTIQLPLQYVQRIPNLLTYKNKSSN